MAIIDYPGWWHDLADSDGIHDSKIQGYRQPLV